MAEEKAQHRLPDEPTLDDNPGLEHDEATPDGKMMTAEGSTGPEREEDDERESRRSRKGV